MADPVTGAVVGAAFQGGVSLLHDVTERIKKFRPILERFESMLDDMEPVVQGIKESNRDLDRPEKEIKSLTEKMEKGKELVLKCSKIKNKRWGLNKCVKAYSYSKQLKELIDAIEKFCQVELALQTARTVLENSVKLDQKTNIVLEKLDQNTNIVLENLVKLDQSTNTANQYLAAILTLLFGDDESKGDEDGKAEGALNKPTEVGKVDPTKHNKAAADDNKPEKKAEDKKPKEKTKKNVELVSPLPPKKDNKAAADDNKPEKKAEDKKPKEKTKKNVELKRPVEVVLPKKEKEGRGDDGNKKDGGGGRKKKGGGDGGKEQDGGGGSNVMMENRMQVLRYTRVYVDNGYWYGNGFNGHWQNMFSDDNPNACSIM